MARRRRIISARSTTGRIRRGNIEPGRSKVIEKRAPTISKIVQIDLGGSIRHSKSAPVATAAYFTNDKAPAGAPPKALTPAAARDLSRIPTTRVEFLSEDRIKRRFIAPDERPCVCVGFKDDDERSCARDI